MMSLRGQSREGSQTQWRGGASMKEGHFSHIPAGEAECGLLLINVPPLRSLVKLSRAD